MPISLDDVIYKVEQLERRFNDFRDMLFNTTGRLENSVNGLAKRVSRLEGGDKNIEDRLLPCPFCGAAPKKEDRVNDAAVVCHRCGAEVKALYLDFAIAVWNKRVKL